MYLNNPHLKVSVILPFFNSENTIERAINSLQNQTYEDFECIFIDNNSTDNSAKIVNEYQRKNKRFKIIQESKQGVAFASNTGEILAKGKYICRMDADDWMFPERLKLQAEFLDKNVNYGAVSGLVEYVSHQPKTEGFQRYVEWVNSIQTYNEILHKRFIESPIVNPTAMWRKSVSEKYGMYRNGNFPEDYELWLRWLDNGVKICKVSRPLIKWYDSNSRLTRSDQRYSKEAFYEVKSKYLAKWLTQNNPHHPEVTIWGASRISRKRAKILEKYEIDITAYIDISVKRKLDKEILLYSDIPSAESVFILVFVARVDLRVKIQNYLKNRGYTEGKNFLFVS